MFKTTWIIIRTRSTTRSLLSGVLVASEIIQPIIQQPPKPRSSQAAQQLRKGNTSDIRDLLSPQDLQTDRGAEETPLEPAAHRH